MIEEITYISKDGLRFSDKEECLKRNILFDNVVNNLIFLDEKLKKYDFNSIEDIIYLINYEIEYIYIKNEIALNYFIENIVNEYYFYDKSFSNLKCGINYFNYDFEIWESLDIKIKSLQTQIKKIENIKRKIKNNM